MKYKVTIHFSDGNQEEVDDLFDTEEEAQEEVDSWYDNWNAGGETLELAGEDYSDASISGYSIEEVED